MVKKDIYIVSSIKTLEFEKILTLSRDNIKTKVNVPRFSPVMKNDELFMSGVIDKKIWLKNFENKDELGEEISRSVHELSKLIKDI